MPSFLSKCIFPGVPPKQIILDIQREVVFEGIGDFMYNFLRFYSFRRRKRRRRYHWNWNLSIFPKYFSKDFFRKSSKSTINDLFIDASRSHFKDFLWNSSKYFFWNSSNNSFRNSWTSPGLSSYISPSLFRGSY